MKKFSVLLNEEQNSLIASITNNGDLILEDLPELDTYQYIGTLFNAIGKLDRTKQIKIFFNLKTLPFAFILLVLKIKSNTDIDINIYLKDMDTYEFIQEFLNADPNTTKSFFTQESEGINKNKYGKVFEDKEDSCDINIKKKFQKIKKELDQHEEIIKRDIYLKDVENNKYDDENIKRYLEIIKNTSKDNFVDLVENNLVHELRKLSIEIF